MLLPSSIVQHLLNWYWISRDFPSLSSWESHLWMWRLCWDPRKCEGLSAARGTFNIEFFLFSFLFYLRTEERKNTTSGLICQWEGNIIIQDWSTMTGYMDWRLKNPWECLIVIESNIHIKCTCHFRWKNEEGSFDESGVDDNDGSDFVKVATWNSWKNWRTFSGSGGLLLIHIYTFKYFRVFYIGIDIILSLFFE